MKTDAFMKQEPRTSLDVTNLSPGNFSGESQSPTYGGFKVGDDVYIKNFQFDIIDGQKISKQSKD